MNKFNKLRKIALYQHRCFSNSVYLWGSMPRLGPKSSDLKQTISIPKGTPEKVEFFENLNIQKIKIGMRHSAAICQEGGLYMFGSGNWGILGQGNEKDYSFKNPVKVQKFEKMGLKVVDVCLGEYHTMALTDDGSLWTWGYAGKKGFFNWMYTQEIGALGHGDKEPHFVPKKVKFFEDNNIKIKSISAGLYFCNVLTEDQKLYSWGRGLYGVLGNGSNSHELLPTLNEDVEAILEEDPENKIVRIDSADEYTVMQMSDGSLYAWGKNDRGQMGTGAGIGIDMVECENVPTLVDLKDENEKPMLAKTFTMGQNTMMIQDTNNSLYQVGLKLHYLPKKLKFDPTVLKEEDVKMIGCGRKHYIIVTKDNNLLVWGNVFKEGKTEHTEGFDLFYGDTLFADGKIEQLEVKYSIFGALVKN